MQPTHPPAHELSVREILPTSRNSMPEWEVSFDRRIIGYVRAGRSRSITFYEAVGIHNVTGEEVSLEVSTGPNERVGVVHRFWLDPLSARQHLPWGLRHFHGLA